MLVAGDQIDVWIVEKSLGSGGMGSVYRCRNRNATRISAAVKVLDSDLRRFPEAEARFIREAEILFRLDHPSIVKVRNVRTDIDPPFLEMEFVEGESLEDRLKRGAIPLAEAKRLMAQLASALAYLHAAGIRHRDIKPANVLIKSDGQLKVVDFGLAMEAGVSRLTQNNLAFGTVSYAPPEWLAPETLDAAKWDVYAAGVVFWEMLKGTVAFPVAGVGSARQQAAQVIFAKQAHAPLDPGDDFPEGIRAVIRDATHSDAGQRIADGKLLLDRLRHADPTLEMPSGWDAHPPPAASLPPPRSPGREPSGATLNFLREGDAGAKDQATMPTPAPRVAAPPARGTRPVTLALGIGGGLLILGLVSLATIASVAWVLSDGSPPANRTLVAHVEGLPEGTPVTVRLNGGTPASVMGFDSAFPAVPGTAVLTWAVGADCLPCPGTACPASCGVGETTVDIPAGSEPFVVSVPVPPPTPRAVTIALPPLPAEVSAAASLGEHAATREGDALTLAGILPGAYPIELQVGSCTPEAKGCFPEGTCPSGCLSHVATVVVPWGTGTWALPLGLPPLPGAAPAPAVAAEPVAAAPRPSPAPSAAPAPASPSGGSAGGLITVGQFAAWLEGNPDWQPGNLNINGYLPGWTGATPPGNGSAGGPVTSTTWGAARAFCSARGGLAALDAAPLTWSGDPQLEWRKSEDGKFSWRANDGQTSSQGSPSRAIGGVGFRCAR